MMRATDATRLTAALVEALHPDGVLDGFRVAREPPASIPDDGIAWIAVPPLRRRRMRSTLARRGFVVQSSWLLSPSAAPRSLIPLAPVSGSVRGRLAGRAQLGRIARIAAAGNARLLEELAPGVGLLVHRPGARLPLAWLTGVGADVPVVVSAGWHEPLDGLVLAGERMIVKSMLPGAARDPLHEAAVLRELAPAARSAGARVPQVLYDGPAGRRVALVEEALPGSRAADLLRKRPSRLESILVLVADWLTRWHAETLVTRPLADTDLERFVLRPARELADDLPDAYLARLEQLGRSFLGAEVPFAAAHNDLTTWNLLLDGATFGVVDWEAAEREALPLVDLDYLTVDAVAAARKLERVAAFERCSGDGPDGRLAQRLRQELRARLDLDPTLVELVRHSCWLGHARNEARRAGPGSPRPFLAVLASLAAS